MTNFIRYLLTVAFKFACWLLITGSLSSFNIFLGLFFCVILPPGSYKDLKIKPILPEIFKSLSLPFLMIKESIELMLIKNPTDHFVVENASKFASKGSNFAGFLDLFRITFTPMSLVTQRLNISEWRVHTVKDSHELNNHGLDVNRELSS